MADETLPSYSPLAITDILPIYRSQESDTHIHSYALHQVSANTQILAPRNIGDTSIGANGGRPSYNVKTFKTAGFMNKKPHVILSRYTQPSPLSSSDDERIAAAPARRFSILPPSASARRRLSLVPAFSDNRRASTASLPSSPQDLVKVKVKGETIKVAEGRFDIMGTGTTITYLLGPPTPSNPGNTTGSGHPIDQQLILESSHTQCIRTMIKGTSHWWQPFPGNKAVLELTNDVDDLVARFILSTGSGGTCRGGVASRTGPATGSKISSNKGAEIGELQIVDELVPDHDAREEIICSAIVVVERARRRAANVGSQGVGYMQGASCGMNQTAYGGGVAM